MKATTMTVTATSPEALAERLAALNRSLEGVDDAIGEQAIAWRAAAADPDAMLRAAERLTVLERQREMLREAAAEAEAEIAQAEQEGNAERVQAYVQQVRSEVAAAVKQREQLGDDLASAVERVAELVLALFEQGQQMHGLFSTSSAAGKITGSDPAHGINTEDVRYVIDQVLHHRLGSMLWPTETAPASRGITVSGRVHQECRATLGMFDNAVAKRIADLKVPA
jgi:hypothetical protein